MELEDRGHAAMADRYSLGAEVDGGEVVRTADGVIYAGRTDFPVMMNAAIPLDGDPRRLTAEAREVFSAPGGGARGFFAARGRGCSVFARRKDENEAARAAGMHCILERYPAMVRREPFGDR